MNPLAKLKIEYGRRRSFLIKVYPCQTVMLLAPRNASPELIRQVLKKRAGWIEKKINYFDNCQILSRPLQGVEGEQLLFLGNKLPLRISRASCHPKVAVAEDSIELSGRNVQNPVTAVRAIERWYKLAAMKIFEERLSNLSPLLNGLHRKSIELKARYMKQQWGSCSLAGVISLNNHLIKTPLYCIDYVIMHELCHLVFMNHSKNYYKLLSALMPDWPERRQRLKSYTCLQPA